MQNAALVSACFKEIPASGCCLFACVTHGKNACVATLDVHNQAVIVVIINGNILAPERVGGIKHANGYVAEIVIQARVGIDIGCIRESFLAHLMECYLTLFARTNSRNICIDGELIEEVLNFNLIGIKRSKVVQNAVVVTVSMGKDPSLDDVLLACVLRNLHFYKRVVKVCGALVIVVTAINDDCIAAFKLEDVAHTDHRVVRSLSSFNTNLCHGHKAGAGRCILLQSSKSCGICFFPGDADLVGLGDPINSNELFALGQKVNIELGAVYGVNVKTSIALLPESLENIINFLYAYKNSLVAIKGCFKLLCRGEIVNNCGCHLCSRLCRIVKVGNDLLGGRFLRSGLLGRCALGSGRLGSCNRGSGHFGCGALRRGFLRLCTLRQIARNDCKKHYDRQKQCKNSFHFDSFLSENFPLFCRGMPYYNTV